MGTLLLLVGCAPQFPAVQSAYISPMNEIPQVVGGLYDGPALSPNGQFVTFPYARQVNLENGVESYPYKDYAGFPSNLNLVHYSGRWSPDGRYFGLAGTEYDKATNTIRDQVRIIDTQTRSVQKAAGDIFWGWSPFSTGNYISRRNDEKGTASVFNLKNQDSSIPLDEINQYDFTQESQVGGSGKYLWSRKLDIPIAQIGAWTSEKTKNMRWGNITIKSFVEPATIQTYLQYSLTVFNDPAAHIVNAIFDPTGEYVLAAQWECADTQAIHCSDIPNPPVTENVTDSIFTLIRWRTGESRELFRLSTIDEKNIIASGDLAWSADGSTILIGRFNAPFVVLKVK
jgi:hypothetical protein